MCVRERKAATGWGRDRRRGEARYTDKAGSKVCVRRVNVSFVCLVTRFPRLLPAYRVFAPRREARDFCPVSRSPRTATLSSLEEAPHGGVKNRGKSIGRTRRSAGGDKRNAVVVPLFASLSFSLPPRIILLFLRLPVSLFLQLCSTTWLSLRLSRSPFSPVSFLLSPSRFVCIGRPHPRRQRDPLFALYSSPTVPALCSVWIFGVVGWPSLCWSWIAWRTDKRSWFGMRHSCFLLLCAVKYIWIWRCSL